MPEKQVRKVHANGMDFYTELRGSGHPLVLIPAGANDCEYLSRIGDILAKDFLVVTFDTRGGSRSMPPEDIRVTPKVLAGDAVGIMSALGLKTASIYGCSSGGQAALAIGKYFPEAAHNIIVHEAALAMDGPFPTSCFDFFNAIFSTYGPVCSGFSPRDVVFICDKAKWDALGEDFLDRVSKNEAYWAKWYKGAVDVAQYTGKEIKAMPNLEFTVGAWSPTWMTYANIKVAESGGVPWRWFNCGHCPEVVLPEEYADYISNTCKKHI